MTTETGVMKTTLETTGLGFKLISSSYVDNGFKATIYVLQRIVPETTPHIESNSAATAVASSPTSE